MRFGNYTPLVEEIVDYARTGDLFMGPYLADRTSAIVETSFTKSIELARTQDPEMGYEIWTDLNERLMSKVRGYGVKTSGFNEIRKELPRLGDELASILKKRLRLSPFEEIVDEVASDFYHCAYKRAIIGGAPDFFETVFCCYRAGGWPCGWRGEYPDGLLVVYLPNG